MSVAYDREYSGEFIYTKQSGISNYTKHELYPTWRMMNVRCYDDRHKAYHRYGARGVCVCEDWRWDNSWGLFNFIKDMGERPNDMSLERVDNDKPYTKENCKWATKREQQNNIGIGFNNTSGALGVTKNGATYTAQGYANNKCVFIGKFNTIEDAATAYAKFKEVKMSLGDDAALAFLKDGAFFKKTPVNKNIERNKTSKYFGVCWSKQRSCWRAYYTHRVDGKLKQKHLGHFDDEEMAGEAVVRYLEELKRGQV